MNKRAGKILLGNRFKKWPLLCANDFWFANMIVEQFYKDAPLMKMGGSCGTYGGPVMRDWVKRGLSEDDLADMRLDREEDLSGYLALGS